MTSLAALIPVLARPQNVAPLVESFNASVAAERAEGWDVWLTFVCSPGDDAEIREVRACGFDPLIVDGGYATKINQAARYAVADWYLTGADDLRFHEGWLSAAMRRHEQHGALVIGTNDMHNPAVVRGLYATHLLVHRDYMARGTIDEPGKILHEGYHHNCNTGDAPIWMGDLTFKLLADVREGDMVIGWKRRQAGSHTLNRLARAEVLKVAQRDAPVVEVTLESGRKLRCTPDHLWLNPMRWVKTHPEYLPPKVGRHLLHVIDQPTPVPQEYERLAGWIAGMYDGEGGGVYIATQSTALHPDIYETVGHVLDVLDIPYSRPAGYKREVGVYCMTGGRQGYLDFLLRIQPIKRERLEDIIFNGNRRGGEGTEDDPEIGAARFGHQDKVISITDAGTETVYALTTTTGNYVAWGYASKNCPDTELVETAKVRGAYTFAKDAHVEHLHPIFKGAPDDATYRLGRKHHAMDKVLLRERRKLWTRTSGERRRLHSGVYRR